MIRIGCAADHAGFECKEYIKRYLISQSYQVQDFGTHSVDSVDYPDFVHPMAKLLDTGQLDIGIVVCGSGNGVNITANKYRNIRSALCWLPMVAALARQHNNANCVAIPARFVSLEEAKEIVEAFIKAEFEGGRHLNRVNKIAC